MRDCQRAWSVSAKGNHKLTRERPVLALLMAAHSYLATLRVMYLYHYFIGLVLAYCLVPLVCAEAADRWRAVRDRHGPFLAGATALLLASFVFYSPLTFHHPLTTSQCQLRNALQSVVACI